MTTDALDGSVALVTGASSGIGQATARELAGRGAAVAVVARRADRLDALVHELETGGAKALAVPVDLTDANAAANAVEKVASELGRLDVLVNAAGVMLNGPSDQSALSEWDQMVDINLRGLLYVTKAALPHLLAAASDSPRHVADVVNVSSVGGRFAAAEVAVYSATKFAVTAATEAWRQEYTRRGLRFSVIEPGRVATELFDHKDNSDRDFTAAFGDIETLHAEDIAQIIGRVITAPRRVAINEVVVRPTDQS